MSAEPEVVVASSADELAESTADRVLATLGAALDARPVAHLVITGGGILEQVLAALGEPARREAIDWSRVHVWWGDERYVAADSSDRNDLPAMAKLFDHVDVSPALLHRMPSSDAGFGFDVEAAAEFYAAQLAGAAGGSVSGARSLSVPEFDVVLLGLGPDGHCASLFPDQPGVHIDDVAAIAVRNSPKPPLLRISLTFPTLDAANEIWFVASGAGKADAVAQALGGADPVHVPSAGPRGRSRTLWLLDRDAAAKLPPAR
jgi:6-phosphogluconolactonase